MRICIASSGRFHVLDLARELAELGHEIKFFSYVPLRRARKFGLPTNCHVSLLPYVLPLVGASRLLRGRLQRLGDLLLRRLLDRLVAHRLPRCEVFICMSGTYVRSARIARERFGALVYVERGSQHILAQKKIIDELVRAGSTADPVPDYAVERELAMYAYADRIAVPSIHVERSFLLHGVPKVKLFRNPYGVDLKAFAPTEAPPKKRPTVIFVGTWSYRKGVDVLISAWRQLSNVDLLHVGPRGDAPIPPQGEGFTHHDFVQQWRLTEFYSRAHVFVLASREEGLAMVLLQALACGLPVVCTDRTGGEDLKMLVRNPELVRIVPAGDATQLAAAIRDLLPVATALNGKRDVLGDGRDAISWRAYAMRYADELNERIAERSRPRISPST